MAKWHGNIGFVETIEDENSPGNWIAKVTERHYTGNVLRHNINSSAPSDSTNNDLDIDNQISIVADNFAEENFRYMRYVEFLGTKWNIKSANIQRPRITLTMGGLYNGEQA